MTKRATVSDRRLLQTFILMCASQGHIRGAGRYLDGTLEATLDRRYRRASGGNGWTDMLIAFGVVALALLGAIWGGPS